MLRDRRIQEGFMEAVMLGHPISGWASAGRVRGPALGLEAQQQATLCSGQGVHRGEWFTPGEAHAPAVVTLDPWPGGRRRSLSGGDVWAWSSRSGGQGEDPASLDD